MTTYRVVLASLGTVFVEADSVMENEGRVSFYRGEHMCAEYASASVRRYEATEMAQCSFPVPEREDSQSP